MNIPNHAAAVIEALNDGGAEAFCVGGCVRDALLGLIPHDWDITTSAAPETAKALLSRFRVIDTGIRHGTVTAVVDGEAVEVTTYRVDGEYSDHRRPDSVAFTSRLEDDLARRDFTVNAIAYHPERGIVDPFGGREDLGKRLLRTVGSAEKRFDEDPLRILRALRFSAVYGFSIDNETASAILAQKASLTLISQERITAEIRKTVVGEHVLPVLTEFADVFAVVIPEIAPCVGFEQKNPHHIYDVWEHIAHSVQYSAPDEAVRLALMLHDIAKPQCFSIDENGVGHFYGHVKESAKAAEGILKRLLVNKKLSDEVVSLVRQHDAQLETMQAKQFRRLLAELGEQTAERLFEVKRGDILALEQSQCRERLAALDAAHARFRALCDLPQVLNRTDLAVDGHDMMALGLMGREIRDMLQFLLDKVMNEEVENEREALLEAARKPPLIRGGGSKTRWGLSQR